MKRYTSRQYVKIFMKRYTRNQKPETGTRDQSRCNERNDQLTIAALSYDGGELNCRELPPSLSGF